MDQVLTLALPFFALILIGFVAGKVRRLPIEGLAWMNFFIVYVSLPALFFQLLSKTPIEQLSNWSYVTATTCGTATAFFTAMLVGWRATHGSLRESTIVALAGGYSNIGYMGPGLTLAALGTAATVPTALIFCFDNALLFALVPFLMALAGSERDSSLALALGVAKRIFLHPFILSTFVGVGAAAIGFHPPAVLDKILNYLMQAAAPCALFVLGVTVASRPVARVPGELPFVLFIKLIAHPIFILGLLDTIGGFDPIWVHTAVLMACLPPALNVFVLAQQYHAYVDKASTIILVGTLVSVVTVTAFLYLVTRGLLPMHLF
jgi:malonate transporter and related proteins